MTVRPEQRPRPSWHGIGVASAGGRPFARGVIGAALATLLLVAPASGQARLRSDVDTTLVTVGDRITLTVQVEHAGNQSVSWPDSLDLAPFEVLGAQLQPVRTTDGGAVSTAVFTVTAFELGELELPSFEVEVLDPDGGSEALRTDRFGIEFVSVGTDDGSDIREIRGPLSIRVSPVRLALLALIFMLLGALLWSGYRRWRRSRVPADAAPVGPPPRPAHEIALEALAELEASPLLGRGEVKEFHVRASDVVRHYVEAVFSVPSLEMTTGEVLRGLEGVEAPGEARVALRRFLERADLVKFAKLRPDAETALDTLGLGRDFVVQTTGWRPPAPAEPVAASVAEPVAESVPASVAASVAESASPAETPSDTGQEVREETPAGLPGTPTAAPADDRPDGSASEPAVVDGSGEGRS